MPVIIKELLIKATVESGGKGGQPAAPDTRAGNAPDRRALIEACVDEVLQILSSKEER